MNTCKGLFFNSCSFLKSLLFASLAIDVGDGIPVDDILETVHHFRAIDYCIEIAEEQLDEDIIKKLHYIIKHDTKDSALSWFAVGDHKKRANLIGGKETSKPDEVSKLRAKILHIYGYQYQECKKITI